MNLRAGWDSPSPRALARERVARRREVTSCARPETSWPKGEGSKERTLGRACCRPCASQNPRDLSLGRFSLADLSELSRVAPELHQGHDCRGHQEGPGVPD